MAEVTKISGEQFIAALKRQGALGPVSALLAAARRVDVIGLSEGQSKALARAIKDFAATKNGPMLIMGLPGPLQALLAFNGTTMPGLDRLGYLKAAPRQVLERLSRIADAKLLAQYPFDAISKSDWIYYLERCQAAPLIPPFVRFLKRPESAGGLSDKEIGAAVLANRHLVNSVLIERIDPDSATELLVSGTVQPLWQTYDFNRFGKEHWRTVLRSLNVADVPKPCERFLANEDGKGFTHAELIELAHHCDLVEQWIDPDKTAFADVYDLYAQGKGKRLWRRFPFSRLNRAEWEVVLNDPKIDIPAAFSEAVQSGMFSQEELCEFAVRNPKVFPFVGIKSLSAKKLVELLLRCDSAYLWQNYPFERLSAADWAALICNYKGRDAVCHAELIGDSEGMSEAFAEQIVRKNDIYLRYIPLKYIRAEFAIELLLCGRHDDLWSRYDFSRFSDGQLQKVVAETSERESWPSEISGKFSSAQDAFSDDEILALAEKNVVNVLELLSTERIQESGVPFFEKICGFAKTSRLATSVSARKLTTGTKPWLELPREYQLVLLAAMPRCRNFIDWQSFDLASLDKLLAADEAYKRELCFSRKLKLFIWRHRFFLWLFLLVMTILATGRALAVWKQARESVVAQLGMLRRIASDGWPVDMLDSADGCFKSLQYNRAVHLDELDDINDLRRAYDSRCAEIVRIKKNIAEEKEQAEVVHKEVVRLLENIGSADESGFVAIMEAYFKLKDKAGFGRYSEEYADEYAALGAAIKKRIAGILRADAIIAAAEAAIERGGDGIVSGVVSNADVEEVSRRLRALDAWKVEYASLVEWALEDVERCRKRVAAVYEGMKVVFISCPKVAEKTQVEVIHEEVMRLLEDIGSASEYGFRTISEAYLRLKGGAGFGRYSEEYADEYAALGAAIEKRNDGVARANAVISAATDLIERLDDRIVDKANVEEVARQLRALDAWKSEYASLVAWRLEEIEWCRKRLSVGRCVE